MAAALGADSAAVGPRGHVYSQNPPFFPESDAEKAMLKRLGNAESLRVPLAQAGIVGKADAVVTAMNLHDVYNGFIFGIAAYDSNRNMVATWQINGNRYITDYVINGQPGYIVFYGQQGQTLVSWSLLAEPL